ncbi:phospholipase D-like domain-containing protein [Legionella sp. D16C41]|uniref:phospholipase D-like domain-containing protein n=1 Tax=Legionella sp. D16C41 TaxID=3402688 RepID=UPI003AF43079
MKNIIANVRPVVDKRLIPENKLLSVIDIDEVKFALREQIFDLIINEVKKAKKQILIQTFAWDKRIRFVQDLRDTLKYIGQEKLNRGDRDLFHVFILLDELGSFAQLLFRRKKPVNWPHGPKDLGLDGLPDNIRIHVGVHHHNGLNSLHSKTVLIDGHAVIITGANFQLANYGPKGNYDAAILLKGNVTQSAYLDFSNNWRLRSNASEENILPINLAENNETNDITIEEKNKAMVLYLTSQPRKNYVSRLFHTKTSEPINDAFITALENAKNIVHIATPNLNEPRIMVMLLDFINKRNGVLQLILGRGFNDKREKWYGGTNEDIVAKLIAGVAPDKRNLLQIKWYSQDTINTDIIHMKFMSIDHRVFIFGSANLDKLSLRRCYETNIVIDHEGLTIKAIDVLFKPAWKTSLPIDTNLINNSINCCST